MHNGLHVVCLKWGDKYPPEYVNRLFRMLRRNLQTPFEFHCLTEVPAGLDAGINILPLAVKPGLTGWWYKLSLFQQDFYGLQGTLLYLDLDVVIVGNVDFLATWPGEFVITKNWSRRLMWNSSILRFPIGKYAFIWERFQANQDNIVRELNGDQEWIFICVPNANIWPNNRVLSYKKSLDSKAFRLLEKLGVKHLGLKAPHFLDTPLPTDAAIVVFHGKPDPEDVAERPYGLWKRASFIKKHWN